MKDALKSRPSPGYHLFMLALCLYALAALAAQTALHLSPEVQSVLDYADYAVCTLFFIDFLLCLRRADRPLRYFATWGWIDLASCIPAFDISRWGRLARVFRIMRVLRGLRATKILAKLVLERRAENTFLAASLVAILLIVVSSISILQFEAVADGNIKTAEDALWWSFATITTVGYGDRFPVTSEGRFVAGILMCAGVGLFGTFSGFLAAWFLASEKAVEESEIQALAQEVRQLRQAFENAGGRLEVRASQDDAA